MGLEGPNLQGPLSFCLNTRKEYAYAFGEEDGRNFFIFFGAK